MVTPVTTYTSTNKYEHIKKKTNGMTTFTEPIITERDQRRAGKFLHTYKRRRSVVISFQLTFFFRLSDAVKKILMICFLNMGV